MKLTYRIQYDEKADNAMREATNIKEMNATKTIQDAPDADINDLMRRMGVKPGSRLPTEIANIQPEYYGDFTNDPEDLRTVLDSHREASEMFRQLPAKIRSRFNNDPLNMLTWVSDRENADEAIKIGLLSKRPEIKEPEPQRVTVTNVEEIGGSRKPPATAS